MDGFLSHFNLTLLPKWPLGGVVLSESRRMAMLRRCVLRKKVRMVLVLMTISICLFTARVQRKSWSISRPSIWWEDVVCDGIASRTPINSLNIIVGLLAKGTLLFTLESGTVLYQSEPALLCGTIPRGTVLLGTVL